MLTPESAIHCDAIAYAPGWGRAFALGRYDAPSPRLAMIWLRSRARDITDQITPARCGPVRSWLGDGREYERALTALSLGTPYTFTARDGGVRYLLAASPAWSP